MRRRELVALAMPGMVQAQSVAQGRFHLLDESLPLVLLSGVVNGERLANIVLDTGNAAAPLVVALSVAKRLALPMDPRDRYDGSFAIGGGNPVLYRSLVRRLEVGGLVSVQVATGISEGLDRLSEQAGAAIEANIGYPLIKDYRLTLNYASKAWAWQRSAAMPQGYSFQMAPKRPLALVEVGLEGQGPYRFAIDTGASYSAISPRLVDLLRLPRGQQATIAGAGGAEGGFFTRVRRLTAGGVTLVNFTLAAGGFFAALSARLGVGVDGILGANAFARRVLSVDYPARRWAIENA